MSQTGPEFCPIPPLKFYRNRDKINILWEQFMENDVKSEKMSGSLSPTPDLMGFYKQAEALEFANSNNTSTTSLSTFVRERENGSRIFIVADPKIFWTDIRNERPDKRCAYEVIPHGAPCLLYLDLEFPNDLNINSNGSRMTQTIIQIICAYLKNHFNIECSEKNVLNLDSTTKSKFSRHLIFRIKNIAYQNNIQVGMFVKRICVDISEYLATNGRAFHDILSYFERKDLEELIVETGKRQKIFIDTNVYTRNRHFRIYKATKWGKSSHLELAPENKYVPLKEYKNKTFGIFLESLVSYLPDKKNLVFLKLNENLYVDLNNYSQQSQICTLQRSQYHLKDCEKIKESPYPAVDKLILRLISPGTIRMCTIFEKSCIVYEISGNRYCANIGRPHKSNNVYWVADLKRRCAYQKCHDQEDCANFKSEVTPFPHEINFLLDDEDDDLFFSLPDNFDNSTESALSNNSF